MSARARRRRAGGLTLVELLVAILILALMTVLGWRALDGVLASRMALSAQLDAMRGHQLAFAQLEADCAQLMRSAALDGQPTLSVAPGRLVLLRAVAGDGGADHMQVVVYHGDGARLMRGASLATRDLDQLRAAWSAALRGAVPPASVALDTRVAAFEPSAWRGGTWQAASAAEAAAERRMRTRRVVRPPSAEALGLQVVLRPADGVGPLMRMFMLGGG
ncbi:general secretion pathway protein J [Duganella sp. CF517]|uniref:PulJ/GspJ family protein n=1 Tax=Duganella sp. CF517 TaxID=1881038 RepID=UPI0008C70EBC|nr:prepilin-type N-terminal cleavage/methylation domain-containing protein [Duganella sp. CF517]SEN82409.1 general secretion pathway protein J [Duganella sp. CF517]